MTRVSENSSSAALKFALNKAKSKVEDLQLKGSTLKAITRPSDDPISNVEALSISSRITDNTQYQRNADYAVLSLDVTEKAIEDLTEILSKAKEISIAQSSDFYDKNIRNNVSNEIQQLRNQALAIANKRVGQKYIFGGFKTLDKPFSTDGKYHGDNGKISIEVAKDFFITSNLNGNEIFFNVEKAVDANQDALKGFNPNARPGDPKPQEKLSDPSRDLASIKTDVPYKTRENIFTQLDTLISALQNNDVSLIQNLLEKFDSSISRLITLRTRIGSISNSVAASKITAEAESINSAARRSQLVDADITELFSDLQRQQSILKTTYQSSNNIINKTLLDFLR